MSERRCPPFKGAQGLGRRLEMLRMGVEGILQQTTPDLDIAAPDRGEGRRVQQLRTLDLGHLHQRQLVIALRRTG